MPTETFEAESGTGYLISRANNSTWTVARNGTDIHFSETDTERAAVGLDWVTSSNKHAIQTYVKFDTSTIPVEATITEAKLELTVASMSIEGANSSPVDLEWYCSTWTDISTSGSGWNNNWRTPAEVEGMTKLANKLSTSMTTQVPFQLVSAHPDISIIKGGITSAVLLTAGFRDTSLNPPSRPFKSVLWIYSFAESTFAYRPRLIVTYSVGGFEHLDSSSSGLVVAASGSGNYLENSGAGLIRKAGTEGSGSLIISNGHILTKK